MQTKAGMRAASPFGKNIPRRQSQAIPEQMLRPSFISAGTKTLPPPQLEQRLVPSSPCGFCSLDTRVVSAWRKADRKRCPGPDFPSFNHQSPGGGEGASVRDLPPGSGLSGYHPGVPQGEGSRSFGASPYSGEALFFRSFALPVSFSSIAFDFFFPCVHPQPSRPIFDI